MDRALDREHLLAAFGAEDVAELPSVEELTSLIARVEIELVRGLAEAGFSTNLSELTQTAWYLHGIASTGRAERYPEEQRRRAFAVSAHVLDLLAQDPNETGERRLETAFAAQVGYHGANESPNATAMLRRVRNSIAEPAPLNDSVGVALQTGILFLGLDLRDLRLRLRTWLQRATDIAVVAALENLDGTMFGATERLLRGVDALALYLREGGDRTLDEARTQLEQVAHAEVGPSEVTTRWVASHLLTIADDLGVNSLWSVLPQDSPDVLKQAFTLDRQAVLTLWPPQRRLIADPAINPLSAQTDRLLVSVPTSAGKTLVAQLAICAHVVQDTKGVCYITPLRSLGREMRASLRSRLRYLGATLSSDWPDIFGLVGEEDGGPETRAPIVDVMTPERLMNALRQAPDDVVNRFDLFIIDEVHLLAQQGGRGLLLEGLLAVLDAIGARLILLSGVIGNAASLAAWTANGSREVLFTNAWRAPRRLHALLTTEMISGSETQKVTKQGVTRRYSLRARFAVRPTESTEQHLVTSAEEPIGQLDLNAKKKRTARSTPSYEMTARASTLLLRAGSLLMVVSQRSVARNAARVMAEHLDEEPRALGIAQDLAEWLSPDHPLVAMVRKGVAYHHAGLPTEVQEAIEDGVRSEAIKAVVATSTLTDGINLPVRTVVIATTEYEGQDPGLRMSPAQLLNAVGRAGRAGKESEGWIVLALQKQIQTKDFRKLTPGDDDLHVSSTLTASSALESLSQAEALIAETQDAVLHVDPGSDASGFINYVWFVLHTLELVPDLQSSRTWPEIIGRLFAFTELTPDLQARWMRLAGATAETYARTSVESRGRWARAGTSLSTARRIEVIAGAVADKLSNDSDAFGELGVAETMQVLFEERVFAALLSLPEAQGLWRFRPTPRGELLDVEAAAVVQAWIAGRGFEDLAARFLGTVQDPVYRLEQMVDGVSGGLQHFLSWTVGIVVAQVNEILLSRLSLASLCPLLPAYIRYGVDTEIAVELLAGAVKSRSLAGHLGRIATRDGLDRDSLRTYLNDLGVARWRDELGANRTDVADLLQYVRGEGQDKLAELMKSGSTSASVRLRDGHTGVVGAVVLNQEPGEDALALLDEEGVILGEVAAADQVDVDGVINSGVDVVFSLRGSELTLSRAGAPSH